MKGGRRLSVGERRVTLSFGEAKWGRLSVGEVGGAIIFVG